MSLHGTRPRIDDRHLIRGGKLLAGSAVTLTVLGLGTLVVLGEWRVVADAGAAHFGLWAVGIGSLAWVTIGAQPRSGVVWTLALASFFASMWQILTFPDGSADTTVLKPSIAMMPMTNVATNTFFIWSSSLL